MRQKVDFRNSVIPNRHSPSVTALLVRISPILFIEGDSKKSSQRTTASARVPCSYRLQNQRSIFQERPSWKPDFSRPGIRTDFRPICSGTSKKPPEQCDRLQLTI
jgi:hypothetical protein